MRIKKVKTVNEDPTWHSSFFVNITKPSETVEFDRWSYTMQFLFPLSLLWSSYILVEGYSISMRMSSRRALSSSESSSAWSSNTLSCTLSSSFSIDLTSCGDTNEKARGKKGKKESDNRASYIWTDDKVLSDSGEDRAVNTAKTSRAPLPNVCCRGDGIKLSGVDQECVFYTVSSSLSPSRSSSERIWILKSSSSPRLIKAFISCMQPPCQTHGVKWS